GLRAVLFYRRADRLNDAGIDSDQIVAAHSRLARNAGGDDDDIGARDIGIVIGAVDDRVISFDRRPLDDVEGLALRHDFDDIDKKDIREPFEPGEKRQGAADL